MTLLPETVKDYPTAAQYLGDKTDKPLENNTRLIRLASDCIVVKYHDTYIVEYNAMVKYHDTYIVEYNANGEIYLNTGGWHTHWTKVRLNKYQNRVRIYQEKGVWYYAPKLQQGYDWDSKYEFKDGMTV